MARLEARREAVDGPNNLKEDIRSELVDLYFQHEHPWYPVLDERLFRAHVQSGGRFSSELLLNCVLAVASRYSDRVEVRSVPDDPNTAGKIYLEKAEVLLHFDLKWPSITSIQSLAILGMIYFVSTCSCADGHH